jgi:hypothetical protein
MRKDVVIQTLESLPNEFNIEELVEKLLFLEKVEKGLDDSKNKRLVEIDHAKKRFANKLGSNSF